MTTKTIKLAAAAAAMLCCGAARAVVAYPGPITVTQPDGTTLTIIRQGDEWNHRVVTLEGREVAYNSGTREWVPVPMGQRQAPRTPRTARRVQRISDVPTTGSQPVLILLVEFQDRKFTDYGWMDNAADYYSRFFLEKGFADNGARGSAHDYYSDCSRGLYDPQFTVVGPVTVSGRASDYAGSTGVEDAWKMINEAALKADTLFNIDYSVFDRNNDGAVDNVYCIYAGYGQADSRYTNVIWPHSDYLDYSSVGGDDHSVTIDGVKLDMYTVSQEVNGQTNRPAGIGTFVHEFGHVLGLADHYNTEDSYALNQPGQWDVMASGSYNGGQNCPAAFNAFERYSLGWMTLPELSEGADTLLPLDSTARRVSVTADDEEYFVLENRQQTGWDAYLPGHGMLVWHINENRQAWEENTVNNDPDHPYIDLVEADGRQAAYARASQAFPGTYDVTAYDFTSWAGDSVFSLAAITEEDDGNITFTAKGDKIATGVKALTATPANAHRQAPAGLYHLNGTRAGNQARGVLIGGGRKYVVK